MARIVFCEGEHTFATGANLIPISDRCSKKSEKCTRGYVRCSAFRFQASVRSRHIHTFSTFFCKFLQCRVILVEDFYAENRSSKIGDLTYKNIYYLLLRH